MAGKMVRAPLLDRATILGAEDMPTLTVNVEEWGGRVTIRSISAAERDAFDVEMLRQQTEAGPRNVRAALVALCLVDGAGKRLFSAADAAALAEKSGKVMDRLYARASKLNGFDDRDIEELEGN